MFVTRANFLFDLFVTNKAGFRDTQLLNITACIQGPLGRATNQCDINPSTLAGLTNLRTRIDRTPPPPRPPPQKGVSNRGKFFLRCPLARSVFGLRWAIFMESKGGVAAIVCDTTGNAVRQGYCNTCLAIGGVF